MGRVSDLGSRLGSLEHAHGVLNEAFGRVNQAVLQIEEMLTHAALAKIYEDQNAAEQTRPPSTPQLLASMDYSSKFRGALAEAVADEMEELGERAAIPDDVRQSLLHSRGKGSSDL